MIFHFQTSVRGRIALLLMCLFPLSAAADECPYSALDGKKDSELLNALHSMIVDHTVLSYNDVRGDRAKVDMRDDGTIWDIYSDCRFTVYDYCGTATDYEACDCYNREHALPKSWWGSDKNEPMYTDLHHVFSTDFAANSQRGAWAYGEVTKTPVWSNQLGSKVGYGTFGTSGNNYVFEPADEYKGDIARVYFYMVTCYNDKNFTQGGKGYQMFNYSGGKASFTDKALAFLLKWHRNDPVSDKERTRNAKVLNKQNNENPFVIDPNLVEYIWGNRKGQAYACSSQGIENAIPDAVQPAAVKVIRDGQLLIIRDGRTYTVTGQRVE